jgi:hypothetical protein
MLMLFDHGIYIWEMYELYSAVTVEILLYMHAGCCLDET